MPKKSAARINICIPGDLAELLPVRVSEEDYNNVSRYFTGLFVFDLIARCEHRITSDLMRDSQQVQDRVYMRILEDFAKNERKTSQWLIREIRLAREEEENASKRVEPYK